MGLGNACVGRRRPFALPPVESMLRPDQSQGFSQTAAIDWQSFWKPATMSASFWRGDLDLPATDFLECGERYGVAGATLRPDMRP